MDLYQHVAAALREHDSWAGKSECSCGWSIGELGLETWEDHAAQEVGDILIDLAGTGQLLASIDRVARFT